MHVHVKYCVMNLLFVSCLFFGYNGAIVMHCYLCHKPLHYFFTKNSYRLYRCLSCGLVETELGVPYKQFVRKFYDSGYFLGDNSACAYKNYENDKPYIVANMRSVLSRIKLFKETGTLLDVGCAYGYFVELALKNGFDAYGFDPSQYAVSKAEPEIKKRIHKGTLSDVSYQKNFFDIVTMFDVFEHFDDPIADLQKVRVLLKGDGIIMIATGDTDSLAEKILKRRWTFYIPPQHLFFFNKKTITETLNRAGFEPVTFFRIGKWLSLSYVLHLAKTSSESRFASILIPIVETLHLGSFPLYLPLGDNMVVVARKK